MATVFLNEHELHTFGDLPTVGSLAPNFTATRTDLSDIALASFKGQPILINMFPSIDTNVCFESVNTFNERVTGIEKLIFINIFMDLPFALKRAQESNDFSNSLLLSDFRNREFGEKYNATIVDGPLAGLLCRGVIVLDNELNIVYEEQVEDINVCPNYAMALEVLQKSCL